MCFVEKHVPALDYFFKTRPSHHISSTSSPSNSTTTQSHFHKANTNMSDNNDQSKSRTVNKGWGGRPNFQASYGLRMDPDGIAEGNAIIEGFAEIDRQNAEQGQSEGGSVQQGGQQGLLLSLLIVFAQI